MSQMRSWVPVLEGEFARKAEEAVREIGLSLREASKDGIQTIDGQPYSLCGGRAGFAVFFAYLAQAWPEQGHQEFAVGNLEESLLSLSWFPMSPSFFGGYSGIGWALQHLQESVLEKPERDPSHVIDLGILHQLQESPWKRDYDLVSGLVGFALYALERMPLPASKECLSRIVDRIDELAVHHSDGVTWFTQPELLPSHQREFAPKGYYNMGLAHGIPGVIVILAAVCHHGISVDKARPLLEGAVSWMFSRQQKGARGTIFPEFVLKEKKSPPKPSTRSAWCYGDPGTLAALFAAARAVESREWQEQVVRLALEVAGRSEEECGAVDASLCHGTAGLGQIFNRFFQATGEEEFRIAARKWFRITLQMRKPGRGYGGYLTAFPKKEWKPDPGLLTGSSGIGLALLSASTEVEPQWDRYMLLSLLRSAPAALNVGSLGAAI